MRYTLRDEGYAFKKIYNGRRWVGRVLPHADGGYLGTIKQASGQPLIVRATTEREAFEQVAARAMGYADAATLHARNSAVRSAKRAARERGRAIAQEYLSATTLDGRMAALDKIFK